MPRHRDDRHLRVIEVWIVPARRLRIIHCDEKAGIVLVGDLISSKVEGVHADAMQWLFIIAPDFAAHPKPTAWDAHHYWFPGFDPGSWRGCHTRPSNPNSHLQPGGNGLREHDTLEQRPRAKVIRSVFVHPTCPTSHNAFSGLTVAVGTTIADRPPHRSVQARLRIRLLSWMSGGKAGIRIRMQNAGLRNPPVQERDETIPSHLGALTATD